MSNQAEETEVVEDVAEELEEASEVEQEEVEQTEAEQTEETEASESGEVVVSIGDESPPSEDEELKGLPAWVKDLRREHREKSRKLRKLEEQMAERETAAARAVTVGAKPTLEGCDYDGDKFEAELTAWHDRKRQADEAERKQREAAEADQKAWNAKLDSYSKQKAALKVSDYEDTEAQAMEFLSGNQPQIIVAGADNPAAVIYALGKNPAKAKELASITDPVKFAFAVAKLETQVKVTQRKAAPLPETRLSGSGRTPVSSDTKLAEAEAAAEKSGDYSKVVALRAEQRKRKAG